MKKRLALVVAIALLIGTLAAVLWLVVRNPAVAPQASPTLANSALTALLNTDQQSLFAEVQSDRPFNFPSDHAAHPDFRTETWYFTATLQTSQSRFFGFQLVFFRIALTPEQPDIDSAWATHQIYRAYFALSDQQQNQFYTAEKLSRAALGLAGAKTEPPTVWVENWRITLEDNFEVNLEAEDTAVQLTLNPSKPPLTDVNLTDADQPFHAYVLPKLQAEGRLTTPEGNFSVKGNAWFDHAWGLVPMGRGQLALNRFVIQLDDQREILIFQLRRRDGSGQPLHFGLIINADGKVTELRRRDIELSAKNHKWYSRKTGISYPLEWQLTIAQEDLNLTLTPLIEAQEFDYLLRYWAGTMNISGKANGKTITGNGHIELTGYTP